MAVLSSAGAEVAATGSDALIISGLAAERVVALLSSLGTSPDGMTFYQIAFER